MKLGVQCPKCGSVLLFTKETRRQENKIMRRKKCHHCGETFKTVEVVDVEAAAV